MAKIQIKFVYKDFGGTLFITIWMIVAQSLTHHPLNHRTPWSSWNGKLLHSLFSELQTPSSCGSGFCVTSRLREVCSTSCQDWPKVLLGENNAQPVDYSSWECSSSSSGQWRISREATGNSWDGFIVWISFSFFEIELHFLQFLNKNKLFQTLNKQSPGFRSQASNFFFVIWSRTVHTLYLAEKNSYLFC